MKFRFFPAVAGLLLSGICLHAARAQDAAPPDAALAAAIAACDRGASVPLDPLAKAPPVHSRELPSVDGDREKFDALLAACNAAIVGAPDEPRLMLQLIRVALGDFRIDIRQSVLRRLAGEGVAEAQYLYWLVNASADAPDPTAPAERERLEFLLKAANAGHAEALDFAWRIHEFGQFVRRDPRESAKYIARMIDLPSQGPVGEWAGAAETRAKAVRLMAVSRLRHDGYSDAERADAFQTLKKALDAGLDDVREPLVMALRAGRGVAKNPFEARAVAEAGLAKGDYSTVVELAGMLRDGEGGPANPRRALELLRDPKSRLVRGRGALLSAMLLDHKATPRDPRAAILALQESGPTVEDDIQTSILLRDHRVADETGRFSRAGLVLRLRQATALGEPFAGLALAMLKLTGNQDFRDIPGARAVLAPLARAGDFEARMLLALHSFNNLDSGSGQAVRAADGLPEAEILKTIEEGVARNHTAAFLLQGRLMRKGLLFPQDDEAATRAIVKAAQLGNLEAMLAAGEAFDKGLGVAKNPRERMRYWRAGATRGYTPAREAIVSAFTFDSFDRLISPREGVTEAFVLNANGTGSRYASDGIASFAGGAPTWMMGMFRGGRASQIPMKVLAAAVMDGWRIAPAALSDARLVPMVRALPDEMRVEIEKALIADGKFKGPPQGFFGPDAREGLRAWAAQKGWAENPAEAPGAPAQPPPASGAPAAAGLAANVVDAARDKAFRAANAARNDKEKQAAIRMLAVLARYGDLPSRWAIMRNYHQSRLIRAAVTPAEVTRYGLDILVTRPPQAEKADFEFIFNVTEMNKRDRGKAFGLAVLDAMRDDPRLQDLTTMAGLAQQMKFAPAACEGITAAARQAKIAAGADACEEAGLESLIAFAKKAGPAGIDRKARDMAGAEVAKIAQ